MSSSGGEAQKVDEGGGMYTEVGQRCLGCFGSEAFGVGIEAMSLHIEQEVANVLVVGPGSDACSRRGGGDTVPSRLLSWPFLPGRWGRCCLEPGKPSSNLWEMRHGSPSSFDMRARATHNP